MLEPDPFYKPLPKNPNLLVKKKREYELVGARTKAQIKEDRKMLEERENRLQAIKRSREKLKTSFGGTFAVEESTTTEELENLRRENNKQLEQLRNENKKQLETLEKVDIKESEDSAELSDIIEKLQKQNEVITKELEETPVTAPSTPRTQTKKPKLIGDEESVIKELEEYFEPIFQQAMEPFWLVIHMIEQDSGKVIYPRYVKDLSMEKRKIPINYGCKTWPEFKMKNHHLGTPILDVMFKKYSDLKKGIGAKSFPEIISDAFFGLPENQRPAWVVNFIYNPVFHFLLQSAYFGALELAANELKFSLKDLIYSPHVNFMFAQFVSVKFVKPKSNAYAAGIQGQDMQYRISSGAYTGQQQNKWLMGCKLWFQDVYYKDMEKQKRIDILDHKLSELQIKMQDLTNKNKERTLYLKGKFPPDDIYIYWGTTTDLNIVNDIREDYVNLDENLKIYLDQFVSEIINPMSEIRMTIIKIASEKAAIQTEQERVLFKK